MPKYPFPQFLTPVGFERVVVRNLNQQPIEIVRLYSRPEDAGVARAKVAELLRDSQ
jgi:hypothetical protein